MCVCAGFTLFCKPNLETLKDRSTFMILKQDQNCTMTRVSTSIVSRLRHGAIIVLRMNVIQQVSNKDHITVGDSDQYASVKNDHV